MSIKDDPNFGGYINESEMIAENARAMPEVDIQKGKTKYFDTSSHFSGETQRPKGVGEKEYKKHLKRLYNPPKSLKKSVDNLINTLEQGIEKSYGDAYIARDQQKMRRAKLPEEEIHRKITSNIVSRYPDIHPTHAEGISRNVAVGKPGGWDKIPKIKIEKAVNPAKERASLTIKKALLCLEGYTPMSDADVMKSFHGTIPDIMKSTNSRPSLEWWNLAINKATFSDDPIQYALSLWYPDIGKGVLGAGGGAAVGGVLGGVPGAALGGMAGEAIESTVTDKSEKAEKACKPWTKKMVEEFVKQKGWALASEALRDPEATGRGIHEAGKGIREVTEGIAQLRKPVSKGVLGAGAGAGVGGALGGPAGAAIGGMAGEAISEKIGPEAKKSSKSMIKDKCMKLAKEIIKSENGVEDLSVISPEQFGRAGIQAMAETFNELGNGGIAEFGEFLQKAVAEPIGSKFNPQPRKGDDFGGESEVSGSGSHVNTADLKPSKKEISN